MFVVSALVESSDIRDFRAELLDWLEGAKALDYRLYEEDDGSISIFLDYATEDEARDVATELEQAWPFRSASLVDDGRFLFVLKAASSSPRGFAAAQTPQA